MQRHLLLKRQQQRLSLEARLLKTQPIVALSTRQQALLPDTLGLYATPALDNRATNRAIEARFQMLASIDPENEEEAPFEAESLAMSEETLFQVQESIDPENEGEAPFEVSSLAKSEQERLPPTTSSLLAAENEEEQLPAEAAMPTELPSSLELAAENEETQLSAEVTTLAELSSSAESGVQEEIRQDLHASSLPASQKSAPALAGDTRQPAPSLSQEQPEPPVPALPASEVLTSESAGAPLPVPPLQDSQKQPGSTGARTQRLRVQEITLEHNASAPGAPARKSEIDNSTQNMRQKAEMREESKLQPQTKPGDPVASFTQPGNIENMEGLFAPRESDRSPQAWLARLNRQAQGEQRQAKNRPLPARQEHQSEQKQAKDRSLLERQEHRPEQRQPEPISQRARTFLKPLIGIDPGEVPIYRDAQAAQATSDLDADALSTGQTIEVASSHTQETPETLGLLAHELTHIARQQRPRFVPPVARPQVSPGSQASDPETLDEEALALHVEQRVRRVMRAVPAPNTLDQEPSVVPDGPPAVPGESPVVPGEPPGEENAVGKTTTDRGIWGNLPAPWEPLPDWLASTPAPSVTPAFPASAMTWQVPGSGSVSASPVLAEAAIQRAGTERSINDTGEESTSAQSAPGAAQEPEPDLDELARQVYGLLKRRLSVEQRRGV